MNMTKVNLDIFLPELLKAHIALLARSCDMPVFPKPGHILFLLVEANP